MPVELGSIGMAGREFLSVHFGNVPEAER